MIYISDMGVFLVESLLSRSLALCVSFVDRCLSFCTFLLWPLCCLFFSFYHTNGLAKVLLTKTLDRIAIRHIVVTIRNALINIAVMLLLVMISSETDKCLLDLVSDYFQNV
jgi:hypothetical protein